MKKREISFPTVLGIIVALGGLVAGLWLLRAPLGALVGASVEETPQQVKITNITDSGFTVSWITTKATAGFVQYGEGKNPELVVSDDRDQEKGTVNSYFTHLVSLRGLKPGTKYSFKLGSGKGLYDQQGQLYQVTTGVQLTTPPSADVTYGQVQTTNGEPAEGAIVYLSIAGIVPQAVLVKSSGSWVIPISVARTSDLTSYAAYDRENTRIELFVQNAGFGTASVITTTGKDSPVPTIVLGKTYDYTERVVEPESEQTEEPEESSKFSAVTLAPARESSGGGTLSIIAPKSGEEVNSTKPEIVGKAPAGAIITIEIHSDEVVTGSAKADANGNFSFSVPENLPPGEHTVTISALVGGVVKKVSKTFTVEAAGESNKPALSATPSAKIKPTLSPRVAYPATDSGVPQSGNLTPTLLLFILGIGLISAGAFGFRKTAAEVH